MMFGEWLEMSLEMGHWKVTPDSSTNHTTQGSYQAYSQPLIRLNLHEVSTQKEKVKNAHLRDDIDKAQAIDTPV